MGPIYDFIVDDEFCLNPFSSYNKERSINCFCIIRKIDTGQTHTTSWGSKNIIYKYEFYNSSRDKMTINLNDWKLLDVGEPNWKNTWDHIEIKIEDPLGEIRLFKDTNPIEPRYSHKIENGKLVSRKFSTKGFEWEEKAFLEALFFIKEISKFKSWESYDLDIENKMLLDGIDYLTNILNNLDVP